MLAALESTPVLVTVLLAIVGPIAALAGSLGAQWLDRRKERDQREHERRVRREAVYAELLIAADILTLQIAVEAASAGFEEGKSSRSMVQYLEAVARTVEHIRLIGSADAVYYADTLRMALLAAFRRKGVASARASAVQQARADFVAAARRDIGVAAADATLPALPPLTAETPPYE